MRISRLIPISVALLSLAALPPLHAAPARARDAAESAHAGPMLYIVEGRTSAAARASVLSVNGSIERDLQIIHAVTARLDSRQAARLQTVPGVRIFADRSIAPRGTTSLLGALTGALSTTTNTLTRTTSTTLN
ncbi:MAG: hypothetical protein ACREUG_00350, partial [Steroidobacteraceae bacterium]